MSWQWRRWWRARPEAEVVAQLRRDNRELQQQKAQLTAKVEKLQGDNEQLRQENERLQELLTHALRQIKRQAAPFSRGRPKPKPDKPGRKPGDGGGKRGERKPPARPDEEYHAPLSTTCSACGGGVQHDYTAPQWQADIVRRILWRLFHVEVGHCTRCGRRVQGRHPLQTSDALGAAAVQVGPEAVVLAAELNKAMGLSYQKAARVLSIGYGLTLQRSTLCRAIARMGRAVLPTYQAMHTQLQRSDMVWMDETGWRVAGQRAWLHVAVSLNITLYHISPRRGFEGAQGLLSISYAGGLSHDGWAPYYHFRSAIHQSCLQHFATRCDALLMGANPDQPPYFAGQLLEFIDRAFALEDRLRADQISARGRLVVLGQMEAALERLLQQPLAEASAQEQRLQKHLRHEAPYLLTFVYYPQAESTNNRAERQIRPAVLTRKTWGGNRTDTGARTQEPLMSAFATYRQRDIDPFVELTDLLRSPTLYVLSIGMSDHPP